MVVREELVFDTTGHRDIHDITDAVVDVVSRSGIDAGASHIFNVGSTASIGTIEFEPGLQQDLPDLLDKLVPPSRQYGHEQMWRDGDGRSHLQATWLGPSLTVPVASGRPVLGGWRQIFLLECDVKPRRRRVIVTVTGE